MVNRIKWLINSSNPALTAHNQFLNNNYDKTKIHGFNGGGGGFENVLQLPVQKCSTFNFTSMKNGLFG